MPPFMVTTMNILYRSLLVMCATVCAVMPARRGLAEEAQNFVLSAKVGALMPGSVYVDPPDRDFDSDVGFFAWLDADAVVARRFSVGLAGLVTTPDIRDSDTLILSGGVTFKARFSISDVVHVRPGLLIAYQRTDSDAQSEPANGLNVGGILETAFGSASVKPVLQMGFISQPTGGSDCCTLTFAPIFYVLGGVEYGQ